nr:PRC-barrel domain-containing protein [Actinoplanes polyasparticus]
MRRPTREDIRGRQVIDREGKEIGRVEDLLIDTEQKRVRFLCVEHDGLFGVGAAPLFIPVEAVERITDDEAGIERAERHEVVIDSGAAEEAVHLPRSWSTADEGVCWCAGESG